MQSYLFPAIAKDPLLLELLALKSGQAVELRQLYPPLLHFAAEECYSKQLLKEYSLRLILQNPPPDRDKATIMPYLLADLAQLEQEIWQTDWQALCSSQDLLPLPPAKGQTEQGETVYRQLILKMVGETDLPALAELISDFFTAYDDEAEAKYRAFAWQSGLHPIADYDQISFERLIGLEQQKQMLIANTQALISGKPANDMLLIGGSGTGKSSSVKATLNHFAAHGLRLIELSRLHLDQLPQLWQQLRSRKLPYLVFIDDLSFEEIGQDYLALKTALDGSFSSRPDRTLIYATSNRRNLMRETWQNREYAEDIHANDTVHEKLSLADRFGIKLFFHTLSQEEYLQMIAGLLQMQGLELNREIQEKALAWTIGSHVRSGRTARQFVTDYLGSRAD